jgi:hypothetical protein
LSQLLLTRLAAEEENTCPLHADGELLEKEVIEKEKKADATYLCMITAMGHCRERERDRERERVIRN